MHILYSESAVCTEYIRRKNQTEMWRHRYRNGRQRRDRWASEHPVEMKYTPGSQVWATAEHSWGGALRRARWSTPRAAAARTRTCGRSDSGSESASSHATLTAAGEPRRPLHVSRNAGTRKARSVNGGTPCGRGYGTVHTAQHRRIRQKCRESAGKVMWCDELLKSKWEKNKRRSVDCRQSVRTASVSRVSYGKMGCGCWQSSQMKPRAEHNGHRWTCRTPKCTCCRIQTSSRRRFSNKRSCAHNH